MTQPGVRLRVPRSIPLVAELLLTFVGIVAATTVVLTVAAYRTSLQNLESDALTRVRAAVDAREQVLTQMLMLRQQRARGFLRSVQSICGEPAGPRGFGWSEECVATMVKEFWLTEGATGALLMFRGRVLAEAGDEVEPLFPPAGAVALVVPGRDGSPDFLLRAVLDEAVLTIRYDGREVVELFVDRSDLGRTGEIFLTDPQGRFLTPSRYGDVTPTGASLEPLQQCRTNAGELIAVDYRGVQTIHGYRPVPAIGGGCIDAHIAYAEALEPAEALRTELIKRGVAFAVLGALLSLIASQWISWPVRRLARAARALQAGDFAARVPMTGPSEIRALARAFKAMASDLAQLVHREQAARREAEDANESKDRFLATLSHELRTPLHAVQGWARMLSTGSLDPDGVQRAARAIERSAESQRRLIDDLLDVSKIVAGRLRMNRSITSLAAATETALDAVRPQAEEKGVTLTTEIEDRALYVMGDPQRLQQIVWNLAWNAIKFTPAGGTVSVQLRRAGARAELIVTDTGVGIAPEVLPHVFEWYRQGNVGGQDDTGLGLGLGLVQQLVELQGGTVRADSQGPGTGATFTVLFPVTLPVRAHTGV